MKITATGFVVLLLASLVHAGVAVTDWRASLKPDAIVDLRTGDGAAVVGATWRVPDTSVVKVEIRSTSRRRRVPPGSTTATGRSWSRRRWKIAADPGASASRGTGCT
jgi:hypothetical protein